MSAVRQGTAGATRHCPHCKATILESAAVCPGCRGHLRFDAGPAQNALASPLRVEGTIRQTAADGTAEYSMVLSIRNERGEEITRQVVGVGALKPEEQRTFSLSVELFAVANKGRGGR